MTLGRGVRAWVMLGWTVRRRGYSGMAIGAQSIPPKHAKEAAREGDLPGNIAARTPAIFAITVNGGAVVREAFSMPAQLPGRALSHYECVNQV